MIFIMVSLGIVAMQLSEAYLRYLPFRATMTPERTKVLRRQFLILSAALLTIYILAFLEFGIGGASFKLMLFTGWMPYFLVGLTVIGGQMKAHVFAFGMEALWVLMLHSLTTMCVYFLVQAGLELPSEIFILHGILYMGLFLALLPWERKLFATILPSKNIFDNQFGWYIAILPAAIFLGSSVLMFDGYYPHPAREQLSRLGIPLFFFLMYRSMSISTRQLDERNQREHVNELVNQQLESLRKYNLVMQEHQKRLAIFRHDRRHNYRLISAMLDQGQIKEAIDYVEAQAQLLKDE